MRILRALALLAAAPDLLATLHEALAAFEGEEESIKAEHRALIRDMRAAIKRAEWR